MWLTDFRTEHNLELDELGTLIRMHGAKKVPPLRVSDTLLHNLEVCKDYRTVPALADLIAEACGATEEQRNALVLPRFRRPWKRAAKPGEVPPVLKILEREKARRRKPAPRKMLDENIHLRPVVMLDRHGNVVKEFPSIISAATSCGCSKDSVQGRVLRRVVCDEFKALGGYTFRYASEWDRMNPIDREDDLRRTLTDTRMIPNRGRGGAVYSKPVTVIDRGGNVSHYNSVNAAADATHTSAGAVSNRLKKDFMRTDGMGGNMYIYREQWEQLSESEQRKLCGKGRGA